MRRTLPWFKMYPQDWLDGTRDLKPEVRGIYIDCLSLIYEFERPLRDNPKWVAHQLHVPVQTWVAARKVLLEAGKLKETSAGLINERAEEELAARAKQCETNRRIAMEREAARQRRASCSVAEAKLNASRARENSELVSEINRSDTRTVQRTQHHAHARENHHQKQIKEKEKEVGFSQSQFGDDDDGAGVHMAPRSRSISRSLIKELGLKVGDERAGELEAEYLASDYALNAKVLDRAFVGWLKNTYGIAITGRGTTVNIGDIIAACGTDGRGRLNTLPSAADLSARTHRLRNGASADTTSVEEDSA